MEQNARLHPLLAIAAVSVTVFSLAGIGALTGLLPFSAANRAQTSAPSEPSDPSTPTAETIDLVRAATADVQKVQVATRKSLQTAHATAATTVPSPQPARCSGA